MENTIQYIGADLGRGYVKGYSEFAGESHTCLFKSIIGDGRDIDFTEYEEPIYINVDDEEYFAGVLAEKESYNFIPNYSDDKTTKSAEQLLYALLSKIAKSSRVKIALGVPNKIFSKDTQESVRSKYKNKSIRITNKINNESKEITIEEITIFRESDAALFHTIANHHDRVKLNNMRIGMISVGFRTTELTYFEKNQIFNDKLSDTLEIGNRTVLDIIGDNLKKKGIIKSLSEIDSDSDYNTIKYKLYENLMEKIDQTIQMNWVNYKDMRIFLSGGTSLNIDLCKIPQKFERVPHAQMVTAMGLYNVAKDVLR